MFKALILTALISLTASTTYAAETCYEETYVPESYNCGAAGQGNFADFTRGGCTVIPSRVDKTEVECPGKWVPVPKTVTGNNWNQSSTSSQSAICASVGLKPATLDGKMCASGERRPNTGGDWDRISYYWGKEGGRTEGGERAITKTTGGYGCEGGSDNGQCGNYNNTYTYCYHNSGKQNDTSPDRLVAYYCK